MTADAIADLLTTPTPPALRFTARAGCRPVGDVERAATTALAGRPQRTIDLVTGLILCWHDHYDASHDRCQGREGDTDADYLHALLHRREGDAGNAGYWFRRVGVHPVFAHVATAAARHGVDGVVKDERLDPLALVAATMTTAAPALVALQADELRALLDHLLT